MQKITVSRETIREFEKTWSIPDTNLLSILSSQQGKTLSFERANKGFFENVIVYQWNNDFGSPITQFDMIATHNGYNCQLNHLINKFS